MRLGVLFSGGKDSCLACHRVMKEHEVSCLITMVSANPESYMFHTPNIGLAGLQAEAIGLPIMIERTEGVKEEELKDLEGAIEKARERYGIQGVVSGAIASEYQSSRISSICRGLGLKIVNPLWNADQISLLREIISEGFRVIVTGVFAYPLGKDLLGREICDGMINELEKLQKKYSINPSGEGGEIETLVTDGPIFKKKIIIEKATVKYSNYSGIYRIEKAVLAEKQCSRKGSRT